MIVSRICKPSPGVTRLLAIAGLLVLQSGCASYYSHYAMFPAENSRGEVRSVRLSWQSAEYPDWWFASDRATPITLETQCSERIWRLHDASHAEAGSCAPGIRACGVSGSDRKVPEGTPAGAEDTCLSVNPSNPDARIADMTGKLELLVACEPVSAVRSEGEDTVILDYIRASGVPYIVYSRKAPRGSFHARPPKFESAVCDED